MADEPTPGSSDTPAESAGKPPRRKRVLRRLLWATGALVVLAGFYVAATAYTSRPAFCETCHEMIPYNDAWAVGPHADVSCIECHVDPGFIADAAHKLVALKEVWIHFTGDPKFPMGGADVPDRRCVACHEGVRDDAPDEGFSHARHAQLACITCHSSTGHVVTAEALAAEGVLATATTAPTTPTAGGAGHVPVACTECHDVASMGCGRCHLPPAAHFGPDCGSCHQPGEEWEFVHVAAADCALCHTAPADHFGPQCSACHSPSVPFADTTYAHTPRSICSTCHTAPAGHRSGECSWCHRAGTTWAFVHPTSTNCAACHTPPANHYTGTCSSCHSPKVPFADTVFVHPSSTNCASCHRAPANHYGTSCASCHSPSRAWRNATFSHPAIPGGEHTYRSFDCANCHPSGYASASCLKCHSSNNPDDDDD